jgi:hypothetical protein
MAKRKPPKGKTVASEPSEHVPEKHVINPGEIIFAGQSSLSSVAERARWKLVKINDDIGKRSGRESSGESFANTHSDTWVRVVAHGDNTRHHRCPSI